MEAVRATSSIPTWGAKVILTRPLPAFLEDLYPTYLQKSKNFTPHQSTLATIIGNCGAIFGGMLAGYASQILGRRFIMLLCLLLVGAFIPVWTLPTSFGALSAG